MRTLAAAALVLALASPALADGYHYTPGLHADPFRAPEVTQPESAVDVLELKLTAIVTGQSSPLAMVEDGKGGSYILHRGDHIGRARVEEIRSGRVTLVEVRVGATGPVKIQRELKL